MSILLTIILIVGVAAILVVIIIDRWLKGHHKETLQREASEACEKYLPEPFEFNEEWARN